MIFFYSRYKEVDRAEGQNDMAARGWDVRPASVDIDEKLIASLGASVRAVAPSGLGRQTSAAFHELWDKAIWAYRNGRLDTAQFERAASKIRAKAPTSNP